MNHADPLFGLALPAPDRPHVVWDRLFGAAPSLAAAELLTRHQGPVCIVARSASAAEQLERDLAFFAEDQPLRRFSDYETLPYESISAPHDLVAERLGILHRLASGNPVRLIVHAEALLNRLPPPQFVLSRSLRLNVGEQIDREALTARLVEHGYLRVEQVAEAGEIALRGAVTDIFPSGVETPVRVEFFDDVIESLRTFDPHSQRTVGTTDTVRVLPAREFPFDAHGIRGFRHRFRDRFPSPRGAARSIGTFPTRCCRRASSITCRCSSTKRHPCLITCRAIPCSYAWRAPSTAWMRVGSSSRNGSPNSTATWSAPTSLRTRRSGLRTC